MHVNLLQQVDCEGVDLREEAYQEGDWEAVGKTCLMHKRTNYSLEQEINQSYTATNKKRCCVIAAAGPSETKLSWYVHPYPLTGLVRSAVRRGRRW